MVGRAPKFLGALKVVPKLVASGSGKKTGRGEEDDLTKIFALKNLPLFAKASW